jgi:hypothetical protein
MTFEIPATAKPGDILTPDGQILCRDGELHEFGYFTVSYEQAQAARAYGWGCRAGVFIEAEHTDEKSWAYADEERRDALANTEKRRFARLMLLHPVGLQLARLSSSEPGRYRLRLCSRPPPRRRDEFPGLIGRHLLPPPPI